MWAGIRAINFLIGRGVEDAIVLEAHDRVGGRARTRSSDGTRNDPDADRGAVPYELGAEWNYDSDINVQQDALYEGGTCPGGCGTRAIRLRCGPSTGSGTTGSRFGAMAGSARIAWRMRRVGWTKFGAGSCGTGRITWTGWPG